LLACCLVVRSSAAAPVGWEAVAGLLPRRPLLQAALAVWHWALVPLRAAWSLERTTMVRWQAVIVSCGRRKDILPSSPCLHLHLHCRDATGKIRLSAGVRFAGEARAGRLQPNRRVLLLYNSSAFWQWLRLRTWNRMSLGVGWTSRIEERSRRRAQALESTRRGDVLPRQGRY
jgi:hypothetical protein